MRYAAIGRGKIVDCFIAGAAHSGRWELAAVYSRQEETGREYAEKHNCGKVYTDLEALAADREIEAVYIASPNCCHAEQSEILLKGGKHVLCEKPITTSTDEYRRLKSLADSLGLVYMEAMIPRYVPGRKNIRKAIGEIGNITMARIDYCQMTTRYEALLRGEQVNIFDMSLAAGTLMDLGVYCVYAAVDLLGVPKDIKASASFLKNGADGSGAAIFDYGSFIAALTYGKLGQSQTPCEIVGDKGSVVIERIGLYLGAYLLKDGEKIPLFPEETKDILMSYEAVTFADFIAGERIEDYVSASRLCENVHACMDKIKESAAIRYPLHRHGHKP